MSNGGSEGPVIYIDRSDVHEGRWDELKAGIRNLVAFVDRHQPQMFAYGFYLDEDSHQRGRLGASRLRFTRTSPGYPSSGVQETGVIRRASGLEVFGRLSERAVGLAQQKAAAPATGSRDSS